MIDGRLTVGLLGHGYWGRNLARNVMTHPDFELTEIADPVEQTMARAGDLYPRAHLSSDPERVITDSEVDVVVIATPLATHFELAMKSLQAGKHVVVTKPLCLKLEEAEEVAGLADAAGKVLLVDNTFAFTGAVRKVRELIANGELGDLVYCSSMRVNLGTYRRDSNVIWDLAPHDVSILDAIGYGNPEAVAATAGGRMGGPIDQIAHISLFYPNGCLAHINVSWLAPVKVRQMIFGGTKKMVVYDDVEPSEKVKLYDKGVQFGSRTSSTHVDAPPEYRLGDMWAPNLDQTEALYAELEHLRECIVEGAQPITGPESGVSAVRILEAACDSAADGGRRITLSSEAHALSAQSQ